MDTNELQSKVIAFLRFPLIVGVVMFHARNGLVNIDDFHNAQVFITFITEVLLSVRVPIFFFMSGFLFFKGCEDCYNQDTFINKNKRRLKTLVVPYLIWNFVVLGIFYLAQTYFPDMVSGGNKLIVEYSVVNFLSAFWNTDLINGTESKGFPIAYQFWFVRDLIIMCLCSPFIYLFIYLLDG